MIYVFVHVRIDNQARRWWGNGLGWRFLYCSGVWFAANWWLVFGHWSVDNDTDWFTEYQGSCFFSFSACLICFSKFLYSFFLLGYRKFFSSLPWNLKMYLQLKVCIVHAFPFFSLKINVKKNVCLYMLFMLVFLTIYSPFFFFGDCKVDIFPYIWFQELEEFKMIRKPNKQWTKEFFWE